MHHLPFFFFPSGAYQSQSDDSTLVFTPRGNAAPVSPEANVGSLSPNVSAGSFSWRGIQLDKLGTYQLQQIRDTYQLELSYNYAREVTYRVTFLHHEQDTLIRFRLTDRHGRETEFTRI